MNKSIRTGVDILSKQRFLTSVKHGQQNFLEKIFTPEEIRNNTVEQLASMFCLKEALLKTFTLTPGSWHTFSLTRLPSGKITAHITDTTLAQQILSLDTSISHENDLIIAVCSAIMEN